MSVGIGIFLLALGAICVWALEVDVAGVDIVTIGYILLAAGALVTIISLIVLARGRRTTSVTSGTTTAAAPGVAGTTPASGPHNVSNSEQVTEVRHDEVP